MARRPTKRASDKLVDESNEAATAAIKASESLAVKHRPKHLKELVGQKHIVTQIEGMLKTKKLPSTILLEGNTGSGKTTTARLLATYINCKTMNACGECLSCTMMKDAASPDYHELNMGSNGKVDDARAYARQAQMSPQGRRRIMVLDEAHALTGAAAQALLKVLEEPPEKTIWILCTTNPEKLLPTILNRCVRMTIKPVEPEVIMRRLAVIARREGVDLKEVPGSKKALKLITDFTNGSLREAISLLENVLLAYHGGADISDETVLSSFITTSEVDLDKAAASIVAATINEDLEAVVRIIKKSGSNARGVIAKMRWLLDFVISDEVGEAKFKPYSGRMFYNLAKQKNLSYSLPFLLRMQRVLVNVELTMNNSSLNEQVLLQTAIGNFMIDEVLGDDALRKVK